MENKIIYKIGDALNTTNNKETTIITHICNDAGGWGAGFVVAISKKWTTPEKEYRKWYKEKNNFKLGQTQFIKVENNVFVANMIAQHGYKNYNNPIPIKYEALKECLSNVATYALKNNCIIQMPRIGTGLAGGEWCKIEEIINETLIKQGIKVIVVDLPK